MKTWRGINRPLGSGPEKSGPYVLDRYAAWVNYVLMLFGFLMIVGYRVGDWHQAKLVAPIDFPTFLARRWWLHAKYLVDLFLIGWVNWNLGKSRAWAMGVTAFLSLSFLFSAIHYNNIFSIFDNTLCLTYPLMRLFGGLGPRFETVPFDSEL